MVEDTVIDVIVISQFLFRLLLLQLFDQSRDLEGVLATSALTLLNAGY